MMSDSFFIEIEEGLHESAADLLQKKVVYLDSARRHYEQSLADSQKNVREMAIVVSKIDLAIAEYKKAILRLL